MFDFIVGFVFCFYFLFLGEYQLIELELCSNLARTIDLLQEATLMPASLRYKLIVICFVFVSWIND